jgi:hypothetical protein
MKLGIRIVHKKLSNNHEFLDNRRIGMHTFTQWRKLFYTRNFHISGPILVTFGIEDIHTSPISNYEFSENRCSESHPLSTDVNEMLSLFCTCLPFWIKFCVLYLYAVALSRCDFHDNQYSERRAVFKAVSEITFTRVS